MKTKITLNMLYKKNILLVLAILFITNFQVIIAQEEVIEPRFTFNYYKSADGAKKLVANISFRGEDAFEFVSGADVSFFTFDEDGNEQELAKIKTNSEGDAIYTIPEDAEFVMDSSNAVHFLARFDGNDNLAEAKLELNIVDVHIELAFFQKGSNRTIVVKANEVGPDEAGIPIEETDVFCYVSSMFGDLRIGEGWLENGEAMMDFPKNLPGDSLGNIVVITRIEESEKYGNVEVEEGIGWGIVKQSIIADVEGRRLWSPNAPTWMVITLIVLLGGVWSHFGYVIFKLYKIKKDGAAHLKIDLQKQDVNPT